MAHGGTGLSVPVRRRAARRRQPLAGSLSSAVRQVSHAATRAARQQSVNPRVNRRAAGPPAPVRRPRQVRQPQAFRIGAKPFAPAQRQAERKVKRAVARGPGGKANPLPRAKLYPYVGMEALKRFQGQGLHSDVVHYTADPAEARRRQVRLAAATRPHRDVFQNIGDKYVVAPAVRALDIAAKPYHAIAGASKAAVEGKSVSHGFLHPHRASFSDVLKSAGVKNKTVRAIAGFGLDVVADPTTYLTGGIGHLASRGAEEAVGRSALRIGARAHVPFTDATKEATLLKVPLPRVPGSERARSAVAETVAPDLRPSHLTEAQHATLRGATREARARTAMAQRMAAKRAKAITKAVPNPVDQRAVIDAVEAGTEHQLPEPLRSVARTVKLQGEQQFLSKKGAGLLQARFRPKSPEDAQAYFPHVRRESFEPRPTSKMRGVGTIKVSPEQARTINQPLAQLREDAPHLFSEDLPAVAAFKGQQTGEKVALSNLWRHVASTGRPINPGSHIDLGAGELFYEVTPHGLNPVGQRLGRFGPIKPDLKEMQKVVNGEKAGRYVILNQKTVDEIQGRLAHESHAAQTTFGRALDRTQGALKFASTMPLPSFHARNLIGDSINAWLGDATARSFMEAYRGVKALHLREAARGSEEAVTHAGPKIASATRALRHTVNLGAEGKVTLGQLLGEAERQGAIRTGFAGSELRTLMGGKPERLGKVRALGEYREDFPRLASYISARKRGLSASQAAEWSLKHHFDYGDLTNTERSFLRRAFPFYTFFARNTRLQATKFLTRPGKYATVAKALDEAAKSAGYQGGYDQYVGSMDNQQQRGLPIPVKLPGGVQDVFLSAPLTDLNQLTLNPGSQFQSLLQRVTFFKAIPELLLNYSTFFQQPIQDPKHPLVPAPDFLGSAPAPVRNALGLKKYLDKRSGRMIWGWPAKLDYVARQLPETNTITQVLTSTRGSRGISNIGQGVSFLTGLRAVPHREIDNQVNRTYDQITKLEGQLSALNQRGVNKAHPTPEYKKLLVQHKQLQQQVYALRKRRGDVVLPKQGGPSQAGGGTWGAPTSGGSSPGQWGGGKSSSGSNGWGG